MKSRIGFVLVALTLALLSAAPALAGRKTFTIDPMGVRTANGAGRDLDTGGLGGISLPDNSTPDFGFGFIIPKGYKANAPIRILFNVQTAGTNCGIVFQPEFVERSRPGHAPTTAPASGGVAAENGTFVLTAPAVASQGMLKVFTLTPSQGFDQLFGDAIILSFVRDDAALSDTCTDDLIVSGINIEYPTP